MTRPLIDIWNTYLHLITCALACQLCLFGRRFGGIGCLAAWAPPSSLFVRPVPVSHRDTRRSSLSSSSRPASSPTRRPRARSSVQRETMPHSSPWFNSGRSAERCSLFNTIHSPDVFARISFCMDIDKKAWLYTTSCLYTWRPRLAKSVGFYSSGLSKKRPCSIRWKFENCDAEACASQPQSSRYLEADEGDVRDEPFPVAEG